MELVDFLRCKGQLRDDIRIGRITIEGICLSGNIKAVFFPEAVEIVLHMKAVHSLGRPVDMIILTAVMAVNGKTILKIMPDLCSAKRNEAITTRERINIQLILVAIFAVKNLLTNLLPLPFEPVGNVRKLSDSLRSPELSVFLQDPTLAAVIAENF